MVFSQLHVDQHGARRRGIKTSRAVALEHDRSQLTQALRKLLAQKESPSSLLTHVVQVSNDARHQRRFAPRGWTTSPE